MHHKDIKALIRKQLKIEYPNWKFLTKKEKKAIAKKVLDEVVKDYDFSREVKTPVPELLGIEKQLPTKGGALPVSHELSTISRTLGSFS